MHRRTDLRLLFVGSSFTALPVFKGQHLLEKKKSPSYSNEAQTTKKKTTPEVLGTPGKVGQGLEQAEVVEGVPVQAQG